MAQAVATRTINNNSPLARLLKQPGELLISLGAAMILGMLVVPLPHWLLDLLLVVNMALTFGILLVTAYVQTPTEFSVFPPLLLVMTLLRLALNISATRLILLHANAGAVISSFGNFVVGGNYVVGIVVFLILVVIQFVVITNGAGRVAEVAARFTLDAMPGKQMAIDADLNAGLIDEATARQRREAISQEADFYGAMDGASKFVRGDAIAAIVMIIVNILGGFIIGVAQRHMDLMTALQTYTLLTVGEGLVTQIPALVMSTATALIVTRTSSESHLGNDLLRQIVSNPAVISTVAVMLSILALVPGLPKVPFLAVALLVGVTAMKLKNTSRKKTAKEKPKAETPARPESEQDQMLALLNTDPLELEVGYGLIPFADPNQGGDLLQRITNARKQIAGDLGFIVPAVRVRDNVELMPNGYRVKLWGIEIAKGEIIPRHYLAISPGKVTQTVRGIETKEPAFGLPALWISEAQRLEAESAGYTVVDAPTVIITHLVETIKTQASEILTRQEVRNLLDVFKTQAPAVVDELVPKLLSLAEVHRVLQNLLQEKVPIKDLNRILTVLGDYAASVRDTDLLTEFVRQRLARTIDQQYQALDGNLYVVGVDPEIEEFLQSGLKSGPGGHQLVLEPNLVQRIVEAVQEQAQRVVAAGHPIILLCSPAARPLLRLLVHRRLPHVAVLSYAEIAEGVETRSLGMVSLGMPVRV